MVGLFVGLNLSLFFSELEQLAKTNVTGIKLFGDDYYFLSASSNQLRAHGAVYVKLKNYADAVNHLEEDFKDLKYLSRVGLFSTSDLKKGDLEQANVGIIEDIKVTILAFIL